MRFKKFDLFLKLQKMFNLKMIYNINNPKMFRYKKREQNKFRRSKWRNVRLKRIT